MDRELPERLVFYFDEDACIGCKACAAACNEHWNNSVENGRRVVAQIASGKWENGYPINVFSYSVSLACHQCENPACMKSCPQRAIQKDSRGIVYIEKSRCVGCGICVAGCPFGMIHMAYGKADKCDMCRDKLEKGESPECISACPMRCLEVDTERNILNRHPKAQKWGSEYNTCPGTMITKNRNLSDDSECLTIRSMPEELK